MLETKQKNEGHRSILSGYRFWYIIIHCTTFGHSLFYKRSGSSKLWRFDDVKIKV